MSRQNRQAATDSRILVSLLPRSEETLNEISPVFVLILCKIVYCMLK